MEQPTLTYFDLKGIGEAARLAFVVGGVAFKDERLTREKFTEARAAGRFPLGQVPVLRVGDATYTQESAILRYAGKLGGLYPRDDDITALFIDEVVAVFVDFRTSIFRYRGHDAEVKRAMREQFFATDAPRLLRGLESSVRAKATSDRWLCGDDVSIADLVLFNVFGHLIHGEIEHFPEKGLDPYPRLIAAYHAVENIPEVKAWIDKYPWGVAAAR